MRTVKYVTVYLTKSENPKIGNLFLNNESGLGVMWGVFKTQSMFVDLWKIDHFSLVKIASYCTNELYLSTIGFEHIIAW